MKYKKLSQYLVKSLARPSTLLFFIGRLTGGGAERQFCNWINSIHKYRPEQSIYVVVLNKSENDYSIVRNNNIILIHVLKSKGVWGCIKVIFSLKRILKQNKIDHVIAFLGLPSLLAAIACLFSKARLITSFRSAVNLNNDLWTKKNKFRTTNSTLSYIINFTWHAKIWVPLTNFIYFRSNYVVFNSKKSMRACHNIVAKIFHRKSFVIPNIILHKIVLNRTDKKPHFSKKNVFKIVIASRLVPEKGIFEFIKEINLYNKYNNIKFRLFIFGDGDKKYIYKIKKICKNEIKLLPFDKHIFRKLKNYDFFAYPSNWNEGSPNAVIEGFANNCIPLISDKADPENIFRKNYNCIKFDLQKSHEIQENLAKASQNYCFLKKNVYLTKEQILKRFHNQHSFFDQFKGLINN